MLAGAIDRAFSSIASVATTSFCPSSVIISVSNILLVIINGTRSLLPLWTWSLWLANSTVELNTARHNSHVRVREPAFPWVFWCFSISFFWLKGRPQRSQMKGFSPVCFLVCTVRAPFLKNVFPQNEHLKFFSPLCLSLCWTKLFLDLNPLQQTSHLKVTS